MEKKDLGDGTVVPKADPTATVQTPVPATEPYKVFNDKEDLTNYIKKTLKEFKEENESLKKEMDNFKKQRQVDSIAKDLEIFNNDIKEVVIDKIDFSKDIKEQIDEIKKKHPSFLKEGITITNAGDKAEKEKKEKNTITDGKTKVFL